MKNILIIILACFFGVDVALAQQTLTLQQAINIALENSPGISAGKNQIKEADAKNIQAKSTFLPKVDVLSKYFYTNNLPGMYPLLGTNVPVMNNGASTGDYITMHPMAPYPNLDRDVLTFDFNVVYPIYTGGKRKSAVASTQKLKSAYSENLNETKASLVLKVKKTFYNYLMINAVCDVYNNALQQLNSHLSMAEKALDEGMRSQYDVLNFKSKIAGFKSKIIEFEGKKKVLETALRVLLALPDEQSVAFKGAINDSYSALDSIRFDVDSIRNSNYKVKYLNNMHSVLLEKANMEKARNKPVLFAFANYHINHGKDFPPFDVTWRNGYVIGVGVKINLFDGNMTKGRVAEVNATTNKIADYVDGLKLKLKFEYRKNIETINSLKVQKTAQEDNLKVAVNAFEIAKVGYKNGVTTNIELNDAQLNVLKIRTSLLNTEKQILIQYANLNYLNGSVK